MKCTVCGCDRRMLCERCRNGRCRVCAGGGKVICWLAVLLLAVASVAQADPLVTPGPSRVKVVEHAKYERAPTGELLPDSSYTPGAVDSSFKTAKEVCEIAWGLDHRSVSSHRKDALYLLYKVHKEEGVCCEIDHRCPRSICGRADFDRNLWAQPWNEAHKKDRLENAVTRDLCAGKITLEHAREIFLGNFWNEYHRRFDPIGKGK